MPPPYALPSTLNRQPIGRLSDCAGKGKRLPLSEEPPGFWSGDGIGRH